MLYNILRNFLFFLDPELSHTLALSLLKICYRLGLSRFLKSSVNSPVTIMGITFPNPIGLAAGLDKNGDYIDALAALGFGFIEIGTITPKPQAGNPKPRLFRLTEHEAIINRMGFNNHGIDYVVRNLSRTSFRGILGINIGKNKDTSNDAAVDDYLAGFRAFWKFASYITINISSPNTPGLRMLQSKSSLTTLLAALKNEQRLVFNQHQKYVPLVIKVSPDLSDDEMNELAQVLLEQHIDAVIATNTTISRDGVSTSPYASESGGLSGKPLTSRSTHAIKILYSVLQDKIPIIASGGVMDAATANEKRAAGAKLIQVYTGFIYQGPDIINKIVRMTPVSAP